MNCTEARKFLSAFVDDELDVRTNVELLEHLEMCPRCVARLERLEKVTGSVARHLNAVRAPAALKRRISRALDASRVRESGFQAGVIRLSHNGWFHAAVAAASVLLVFGLLYSFVLAPVPAVSSRAISAHMAVIRDRVPAFCFTADPERARRMALLRVEGEPDLSLLESGRFELVGAGPAEIALRDVGHFVFRYRAATISMLVFEGLPLDEVDGDLRETPAGQARVAVRGPVSLVAWRRGGFTYILVGELPACDLAELAGPEPE